DRAKPLAIMRGLCKDQVKAHLEEKVMRHRECGGLASRRRTTAMAVHRCGACEARFVTERTESAGGACPRCAGPTRPASSVEAADFATCSAGEGIRPTRLTARGRNVGRNQALLVHGALGQAARPRLAARAGALVHAAARLALPRQQAGAE